MAKTNKELVAFAQKALKENWGYCLGTYGQVLTRSVLNAKKNQGHGVGTYNTKHSAYLEKFIGKRVSDCYGLVKGFIWWSGGGPKYDAKTDRNQEGAYAAAKEKGPLSTLPEIPGIILWMRGHAGIYIGNGEFIEIAGVPVGMRKGRIQRGKVTHGSRFTHWFKDTYIQYEETAKPAPSKPGPERPTGAGSKVTLKKTAKRYATGETIPEKYKGGKFTIQQTRGNRVLLQELYSWVNMTDIETAGAVKKLEEDGYWGPETSKAIQRALKTPEDGVISGQYQNQITKAITGVDFGRKTGSLMVKAFQRKVGAKQDGFIGPETIRAAQRHYNTPIDGRLSKPSVLVKEMQRRLNEGTF